MDVAPGFTILQIAISEIVRPSPLKVKGKEQQHAEKEDIRKQEEKPHHGEEEQNRSEIKAKIKPDKLEPAKVKPPEPKPDATATIQPESIKSRESSFILKFGVVVGVIVLLLVGIWLLIFKPPSLQKAITNSIGMELLLIPAGNFMIGSKLNLKKVVEKYAGNVDWYKREYPQHKVTIDRAFYLQSTEVTLGQWQKVMGDTPSHFKECGSDCPVEDVSWENIREFIKKLNEMEGGETYRLPTEAEWEYAVRAGTTTEFFFGDDAGKLGEYAWYDGNSVGKTHPIRQKKPNAWGLYDMYGNVWEWVEDDWHDSYEGAPNEGRAWIDGPRGVERVIRGGSWRFAVRRCRSANRYFGAPVFRYDDVGFRLARSVPLGF